MASQFNVVQLSVPKMSLIIDIISRLRDEPLLIHETAVLLSDHITTLQFFQLGPQRLRANKTEADSLTLMCESFKLG